MNPVPVFSLASHSPSPLPQHLSMMMLHRPSDQLKSSSGTMTTVTMTMTIRASGTCRQHQMWCRPPICRSAFCCGALRVPFSLHPKPHSAPAHYQPSSVVLGLDGIIWRGHWQHFSSVQSSLCVYCFLCFTFMDSHRCAAQHYRFFSALVIANP